MEKINPAAVTQSVFALVLAITCADTVRDTINGIKPHSLTGMVLCRVLVIMMLVFIIWQLINQYNRVHPGRPANSD